MKKQAILFLLCLVLTLLTFCGCQKETKTEISDLNIYYVNKPETKLVPVAYEPVAKNPQEQLAEFLNMLYIPPADVELKNVIDEDVRLMDYSLNEGQVQLNFSQNYYQADKLYEILRRAAIVKTLSQIKGVDGISISVEGAAILDSKNQPIGVMSAETFIDYAGVKDSNFETVDLHLYYANEDGDGLVSVIEQVTFGNNLPLEKLVLEHLISGSESENARPVLSSSVKVINVTVKDGICYVNLNNRFLSKPKKISDEVAIYSIVNSLTELPNINKVQFMIDGESEITFGEGIYLSAPFERNLEIVVD